ncbi:hypothetical protein Ae201684P_012340 [Aphanomyces euteiches]|uniref:Protein kinase domain-containing protein n=1 Tax=Aphanomyces euteiches TaxID=100861 RepID=A0A6G0W8Y6_9STRA|nr:hypothetical protein Ae201684_017439 [Aphanomyces euteiches]KAH9089057.1 hypothetical protein Ae201684P_012340 [Aphanomyces euteiches]
MSSLNAYLESITQACELRQQMDKLGEFNIQIQRGFEYYKRQMALGNVCPDENFENQVEECQRHIARTTNEACKMPRSLAKYKMEPWMLSSNDIQFDPTNNSTILGQGGFATVYKGTYHGQAVAVKQFDQCLCTDSTELEKRIGREIKVWQDISHEPFILSLIGVCTKTSTPVLISALCQTNIRRFVRDWPEKLIPSLYQFASGLVTIHENNIIHQDLKGENILITHYETVAIADFGLSRTVDSSADTKSAFKRRGTLN